MEATHDDIIQSSIRDNHFHGTVGQFIKDKIKKDSELAIVSAFFTIYAYDALKEELEQISSLRFLYGDPSFTKSVDPSKGSKKIFKIEDENIEIVNILEQSRIARECADWIKRKVEIRSVNKVNFLHGKLYHIFNREAEIQFWTSDLPGNYIINIQGISGNGEKVSLHKSFMVR